MSTTLPDPADEILPPLPDLSERFPKRALLIPLGVVVLTLTAWLLVQSPRVASAILGAMRPSPDGSDTSARVEAITGTARMRPARSAIRLPLQTGVPVYPGDSFQVSQDGGLQLSLGPSVSVRLFAGAGASVVSIGSASEPTTWLTLERGAIVVTVLPDSSVSHAVVATRWGVASLNGTMGVFIPDEATELVAACFRGACRINLGHRQVEVPVGKTLVYAPLLDGESFLDLAEWPDAESWALAFLRSTPTPTFFPTDTATLPPTHTANAAVQAVTQAVPRLFPSLTPIPPTDTAAAPTDAAPPPSNPTAEPPTNTPTLEPTPSPTRDNDGDRGGGDGDNGDRDRDGDNGGRDRDRDRGGDNGRGGGDGGDGRDGDDDRDGDDRRGRGQNPPGGGRDGDKGEGKPDEGNGS